MQLIIQLIHLLVKTGFRLECLETRMNNQSEILIDFLDWFPSDFGPKWSIFKISQKDEKSLDRYEGVPILYKKEYFEIDIEEKQNKVLYYKMTSSYNGYGCPSLKYYNVIEKGYEQNSLNKQSLIDAREFSIKNSKPSTFTSQRWKD